MKPEDRVQEIKVLADAMRKNGIGRLDCVDLAGQPLTIQLSPTPLPPEPLSTPDEEG